MSNRIETNRTADGFSVIAAGVDIEKTLGTAAYREVTTVIAEGKSSIPTAGSVAEYVSEHGGGGGGETYSSEEQVVGTWFGKPLYKKSFELSTPTLLPQNQWNAIQSAVVLNGDKVIRTELYIPDSKSGHSLCFGKFESDGTLAVNPIVRHTVGMVTITYTKTTD